MNIGVNTEGGDYGAEHRRGDIESKYRGLQINGPPPPPHDHWKYVSPPPEVCVR